MPSNGYEMSEDSQPAKESKFLNLADLEKIWQWNHVVPERIDLCVHEMIHEQVIANPSSPAICAWDGDLNYEEMYTHATSS